MGRAPCCDKLSVKKGPWSPEEDAKLKEFIEKYGTDGNWITFPHKAGLKRCGKSCRLRWLNYLRPNIKHGDFTDDEDRIICYLFTTIGSRWSVIATQLPGRTDNDIKNYWNTKLKKKLMGSISIPEMKPNPAMVSSPPQHMAGNVWSFTGPVATRSPSCNNSSVGINNMQLQPYYYYDLAQENILSFGGDQASCSSSDRSSGGNHLGYGGGEMEYDYSSGRGGGGYENRGQMGNFQNLFDEDTLQELMGLESDVMKKEGGCSEKESVVWKEETPLDQYSLEEINRLISSNSSSNCSDNNVSFDQSYKGGEKFTCYY